MSTVFEVSLRFYVFAFYLLRRIFRGGGERLLVLGASVALQWRQRSHEAKIPFIISTLFIRFSYCPSGQEFFFDPLVDSLSLIECLLCTLLLLCCFCNRSLRLRTRALGCWACRSSPTAAWAPTSRSPSPLMRRYSRGMNRLWIFEGVETMC